MRRSRSMQNVFAGAIAVLFVGSRVAPEHNRTGPVLTAATEFVSPKSDVADDPDGPLESVTRAAVDAFSAVVRPLSDRRALDDAFHSYYAYKAAHPNVVKKPYLYFVDYGLPSTTPRGYVFDMSSLEIVDGPFTVAHGRGSSKSQYGVPTRFSNKPGSAATSLGLYVAKALYSFHGHAGGRSYSSIGLRLAGVSDGFNDNALARGVVAHGAPYVTKTKAGRSEGCPAMEPTRAKDLLPKLAEGGMVFLFAPNETWMDNDPWLGDE